MVFILFQEAFLIYRVIGFDEIGGNDNFPTELLERRLQKKGTLRRLID
jgi:hypothetical protein